MQTIVAKYRMGTRVNKRVRCAGFARQGTPNVSSRCMLSYTICFVLGDIWFAQTAIDDCEPARS